MRGSDRPSWPEITHLTAYVKDALSKAYILPVAKVCNAACVFCATDIYDPATPQEMMKLDELPAALALLASAGVCRFEITGGGEPTLHPGIADIIAQVRESSNGHIKLYSNAARLPRGEMIDELNISRCAVDPIKNQQLMQIRPRSMPLDENIERARALGYKRIRLSVPILKGGVESLSDALDFVDVAASLVEGVVFRPLYPATPNRDRYDLDHLDTVGWLEALSSSSVVRESGLDVEVDVEGCFRASQLILASDLGLYRDWSLGYPV